MNQPPSDSPLLLLLKSMAEDMREMKRAREDERQDREEERNERIVIIDKLSNVETEMTKLASDIVEQRERTSALERSHAAASANAIVNPMRPRLPSFTDEDRAAQRESYRVAALELPKQTSVMATELPKQTVLLRRNEKALVVVALFTLLSAIVNKCNVGPFAPAAPAAQSAPAR